MNASLRLCLVLHNHQPIGNFDGVFEQAYEDSYRPFLDVFEPFSDLKLSLHTSGPLMEWLDVHHPEYLDRLANLVQAGRIEIIGGAYYEAILAMIPSRDRVGQIEMYREWLEQRLGGAVRGMWMPERVWEQSFASDLADAGVEYTLLDDFHFRNAGLADDQLFGSYITEDEGNLVSVFPGSERLRYLLPFASPDETISYLREIAEQQPNGVVVFGDDGEKFGTWPDTKKHVYEDGWLRQFFEQLTDNREWLDTTTLGEAHNNVAPVGKIYIPDGSYREMTEWALPVAQQIEFDNLEHEMEQDPRWPRLRRFVRGGFWRNFKAKYPESDEMYTRMIAVSQRLEDCRDELDDESYAAIQQTLYRGQCNCSYWHGAFGGIYLPHLRNAVYHELIKADNLLDAAFGLTGPRVDSQVQDWNLDQRDEIRLFNDKLDCFVAPADGGIIYELDVRDIAHNLLATLTRRPEAYHRKVLAGPANDDQDVASIHDRVVFKTEGLDQRVQYDRSPRKSLLDHFYDDDVSFDSILSGHAEERGDFIGSEFTTRILRDEHRTQIRMSRTGQVHGVPIQLTKGVTLHAGDSIVRIGYMLTGLPKEHSFHFAPEFNFAGLPSGADDRFFYQDDDQRLGHLGTSLDLHKATNLGLVDQWLGINVQLQVNRPTAFWAYPIETVSLSEGGFELVHQSVAVHPHWWVRGDAEGKWSATIELNVDTSAAIARQLADAEFATTN
jgi:hypothetical protein